MKFEYAFNHEILRIAQDDLRNNSSKQTMHDLHEANRISQIIIEEMNKNNLKKLAKIEIELGTIIEHDSDINPENLEFNLRMILKNYLDKNTKIIINKVRGDSWKLVSIDGE